MDDWKLKSSHCSNQARSQDFCKGGGHDNGGTEGPERGARREALKRRGWWGLGRGA